MPYLAPELPSGFVPVQINDIEAQYYADKEDAYDMRKYFEHAKKTPKPKFANPTTAAEPPTEAVDKLNISDENRAGQSHPLEGEHDVD